MLLPAHCGALAAPPPPALADMWRAILDGVADVLAVEPAPPVARDTLALVHDAAYLDRLFTVGLSPQEARRLGFPWSDDVLARARHSTGGTLAATADALRRGLGLNLGGGTHHAYPDRAEGYSVFNDVAVAVARLRHDGWAGRVLVVDLDVHQGNGTAACFAGDPTVFTLSVHAERNYPDRKEQSDLDVALPDGTEDGAYLDALDDALERAFAFGPDLVFFNAGVDVLAGDRFGRLRLTLAGLAARDRRVYARVRAARAAAVVVGGGGYSRDPARLAAARISTYRLAAAELGS